jgi:hypothetical protein
LERQKANEPGKQIDPSHKADTRESELKKGSNHPVKNPVRKRESFATT